MRKPDEYLDRIRRKARARGARHMVSQGLVLYYQSLVHRVVDDTPSYVEQVMRQSRRQGAERHEELSC
jgi:hypothetical protein